MAINLNVTRANKTEYDAQLLLGVKGDTGKSAYQYAVDGGYEGSETDFLNEMARLTTSADEAAASAEAAQDALDEFVSVTATAETLPAGSDATASYSEGELTLGIPKGDKGDKGDTYDDSAIVARMDSFTQLAEGSTTGDAELIDGRVGADGVTYNNIGGAIRAQVTDVKSELNNTQSSMENVAGIITVGFELGGLYSSTGKEYSSGNIRTPYISVKSSHAIFISNPNLKGITFFEYTNTTDNKTKSTVIHESESIINLRSDTKYIRLQVNSSPQLLSDGDGISLHDLNNQAANDAEIFSDLSNGGVLKAWDISSTIKATLYNNGTFAVVGTGDAGDNYSASSLPPWNTNKYMRCIKKIVLDERIKYKNLEFWFTQFDNGNAIYYRNKYDGSINLPAQISSIGYRALGQFEFHHLNLSKVVTTGNIHIGALAKRKFILSVPTSLCSSSDISDYLVNTTLPTMFQNTNANDYRYGALLVITDDSALHGAILDKIDELVEDRGSLCNASMNCMSILCNELAPDGFPSSWTEPMKRCLMEVMPYIGRQDQSRETSDIDAETRVFAYNGLTSLGNYSGYGYPQVFSPKANADIFTHMKNGRRRFAEDILLGELNNYLGQPYSTELSNLTSGVSCSGLISFIFWRYFNENFTLATSKGYVLGKGQVGNTLPLTEIQRDDVKPFDICCMAYDLDEDGELTDNDNGGHTALVLGSREVNGEQIIYILQSLMGIGIVFGKWVYSTETGKIVNYKRLNKTGISENMITYE